MSVNKVILLGHVGQDPEIKVFENDNQVANLTLATTEKGYTKKDGSKVEDKTEWHNLVVWGGLSKVVSSYVKKGTQIYIEGKLRTREYEKDGQKRYFTAIYVDVLQLLGKASGGQTAPATAPAQAPQAAPENNAPAGQNEDLPF